MSAVDKRLNNNAFGQTFLNLRHAFLHVFYNLLKVLPLEHQRYAGNNLALAVARNCAVSRSRAKPNLCHVAHQNRHARNGLNWNFLDVLERGGKTYSANEILIAVLFDVTSAGVLVSGFESVVNVGNGQARSIQAVGINGNLILLYESTPAAHLGNALGSRQLFAHNPVLHRSQVG